MSQARQGFSRLEHVRYDIARLLGSNHNQNLLAAVLRAWLAAARSLVGRWTRLRFAEGRRLLVAVWSHWQKWARAHVQAASFANVLERRAGDCFQGDCQDEMQRACWTRWIARRYVGYVVRMRRSSGHKVEPDSEVLVWALWHQWQGSTRNSRRSVRIGQAVAGNSATRHQEASCLLLRAIIASWRTTCAVQLSVGLSVVARLRDAWRLLTKAVYESRRRRRSIAAATALVARYHARTVHQGLLVNIWAQWRTLMLRFRGCARARSCLRAFGKQYQAHVLLLVLQAWQKCSVAVSGTLCGQGARRSQAWLVVRLSVSTSTRLLTLALRAWRGEKFLQIFTCSLVKSLDLARRRREMEVCRIWAHRSFQNTSLLRSTFERSRGMKMVLDRASATLTSWTARATFWWSWRCWAHGVESSRRERSVEADRHRLHSLEKTSALASEASAVMLCKLQQSLGASRQRGTAHLDRALQRCDCQRAFHAWREVRFVKAGRMREQEELKRRFAALLTIGQRNAFLAWHARTSHLSRIRTHQSTFLRALDVSGALESRGFFHTWQQAASLLRKQRDNVTEVETLRQWSIYLLEKVDQRDAQLQMGLSFREWRLVVATKREEETLSKTRALKMRTFHFVSDVAGDNEPLIALGVSFGCWRDLWKEALKRHRSSAKVLVALGLRTKSMLRALFLEWGRMAEEHRRESVLTSQLQEAKLKNYSFMIYVIGQSEPRVLLRSMLDSWSQLMKDRQRKRREQSRCLLYIGCARVTSLRGTFHAWHFLNEKASRRSTVFSWVSQSSQRGQKRVVLSCALGSWNDFCSIVFRKRSEQSRVSVSLCALGVAELTTVFRCWAQTQSELRKLQQAERQISKHKEMSTHRALQLLGKSVNHVQICCVFFGWRDKVLQKRQRKRDQLKLLRSLDGYCGFEIQHVLMAWSFVMLEERQNRFRKDKIQALRLKMSYFLSLQLNEKRSIFEMFFGAWHELAKHMRRKLSIWRSLSLSVMGQATNQEHLELRTALRGWRKVVVDSLDQKELSSQQKFQRCSRAEALGSWAMHVSSLEAQMVFRNWYQVQQKERHLVTEQNSRAHIVACWVSGNAACELKFVFSSWHQERLRSSQRQSRRQVRDAFVRSCMESANGLELRAVFRAWRQSTKEMHEWRDHQDRRLARRTKQAKIIGAMLLSSAADKVHTILREWAKLQRAGSIRRCRATMLQALVSGLGGEFCRMVVQEWRQISERRRGYCSRVARVQFMDSWVGSVVAGELRNVFRRWHKTSAQGRQEQEHLFRLKLRRQSKATTLDSMVEAFCSGEARGAFIAWRGHVSLRIRVLEKAHRLATTRLGLFDLQFVSQLWAKWQRFVDNARLDVRLDQVEWRRQQATSFVEVASRARITDSLEHNLGAAWWAWVDLVQCRRRLRDISLSMMQNIESQRLYLCQHVWHVWVNIVVCLSHERRRQLNTMTVFVERLRGDRCRSAVFQAWVRSLQSSRKEESAKTCMFILERRKSKAACAILLQQWQALVVEKRSSGTHMLRIMFTLCRQTDLEIIRFGWLQWLDVRNVNRSQILHRQGHEREAENRRRQFARSLGTIMHRARIRVLSGAFGACSSNAQRVHFGLLLSAGQRQILWTSSKSSDVVLSWIAFLARTVWGCWASHLHRCRQLSRLRGACAQHSSVTALSYALRGWARVREHRRRRATTLRAASRSEAAGAVAAASSWLCTSMPLRAWRNICDRPRAACRLALAISQAVLRCEKTGWSSLTARTLRLVNQQAATAQTLALRISSSNERSARAAAALGAASAGKSRNPLGAAEVSLARVQRYSLLRLAWSSWALSAIDSGQRSARAAAAAAAASLSSTTVKARKLATHAMHRTVRAVERRHLAAGMKALIGAATALRTSETRQVLQKLVGERKGVGLQLQRVSESRNHLERELETQQREMLKMKTRHKAARDRLKELIVAPTPRPHKSHRRSASAAPLGRSSPTSALSTSADALDGSAVNLTLGAGSPQRSASLSGIDRTSIDLNASLGGASVLGASGLLAGAANSAIESTASKAAAVAVAAAVAAAKDLKAASTMMKDAGKRGEVIDSKPRRGTPPRPRGGCQPAGYGMTTPARRAYSTMLRCHSSNAQPS